MLCPVQPSPNCFPPVSPKEPLRGFAGTASSAKPWGLSPSPGQDEAESSRHLSACKWEDDTQRGKAPARREPAKTLTPRPRSPVGMELGYPRQSEGGRSDDAFASRWKGKSQNPGLKCHRLSKLQPIYSSGLETQRKHWAKRLFQPPELLRRESRVNSRGAGFSWPIQLDTNSLHAGRGEQPTSG